MLVKLGYDEDYVTAAFNGEDGIVKYFAESYDIDLKNFKSYIEKKQAVQATFDSYVADGISAYITEDGKYTKEFLRLDDHTKNAVKGIIEHFKTIKNEIELQQKVYTAYMAKADSVRLSADLTAKVQNGSVDIREYDSETAEIIDEYKEWYDKAQDCKDLHQNL